MNSPSLLQIVERLERLASKLPPKIRKVVLSELTPLKQLFLQQRSPRFLFAGSSAMPLGQVIAALFGSNHPIGTRDVPVRPGHWHDISLPDRGTICVLDARNADASAAIKIQDELKYQAADVIFFLDDGQIGGGPEKHSLNQLLSYPAWNKTPEPGTKIIEMILPPPTEVGESSRANLVPYRVESAPGANAAAAVHLLEVLRFVPAGYDRAVDPTKCFEVQLPDVESQRLMSIRHVSCRIRHGWK